MMMRQKSQLKSKIPLPASCPNGRRQTIPSIESREKWDMIKGSQIPRLVIPLKRQQSHPLMTTGQHIPKTNTKNNYRSKWESLIYPWRRTISHIPISQTIQMQCTQITHQRLQQRQKDLQRKHQQLIEERDNDMAPVMALRLCLFLPYPYFNNQDEQIKIITSKETKTKVNNKPVTKGNLYQYQIAKPLQFHRFFCSDNRQVNIPCQLMNRYSLFMRQHHKPMQLLAIRSCTLLRLLQWMQRHRHDNIQQLANTLPNPCAQDMNNDGNRRYSSSNSSSSTTSSSSNISNISSSSSSGTPSWDENFLGNGELSQLVELILACNYLGVDPLLMHATHYFGQLMAQRSLAEESLLFGISETLTDVQDNKINHKPTMAIEQIHVHKQTTFRHHQCYHARV